MNPSELLEQTEIHIALYRQNKEIEERIKAIAIAYNQKKRTIQELQQKPSSTAVNLLMAQIRADVSRQNVERTAQTYEENLKRHDDLRRRLKEKRAARIANCYKYAEDGEKYVAISVKLKELGEELAQVQMNLATVKGTLAAKEMIARDLANLQKRLQAGRFNEC